MFLSTVQPSMNSGDIHQHHGSFSFFLFFCDYTDLEAKWMSVDATEEGKETNYENSMRIWPLENKNSCTFPVSGRPADGPVDGI